MGYVKGTACRRMGVLEELCRKYKRCFYSRPIYVFVQATLLTHLCKNNMHLTLVIHPCFTENILLGCFAHLITT